MKKQIIYTDNYYFDDEARAEEEQMLREVNEDEDFELSDERWAECVSGWLDDERCNLNKEVDGVIIAFANLGFWNGRNQGFRILGSNINEIFSICADHNEWFGDGYNIRGKMSHHDGSHYVLYRVVKDMETAEKIGDQIYHHKIDEASFRKKTRSLYPYVAAIYGWKDGRFKKSKVIKASFFKEVV